MKTNTTINIDSIIKTLNINNNNVREALNVVNDEVKAELEKRFAEELQPKKGWPTSIVEVYEATNPTDDQKILLNYSGTDRKMIGAKNFMLAEMIAEAMRGNWVPDYTNTDQPKWFPVFDGRKGFAFSLSLFAYWDSYSDVGSRLCYETEKKSDYAAKTFPEVFKELQIK